MNNNKKNKRGGPAKQAPQKNQSKGKKKTPFSDAGAIVGSRLGTMFNAPYLRGVGKWLGSGIGSIFGSGDYQVVGAQPSYNVLMNGAQIPKFSSTNASNIVCHREYLGDIAGSSAFLNRPFALNPGMATTFPWLATVAQNYQQYKFHGLIFEFRSLITDFVTSGAPGVVVMATNYNADSPAYNTKQEMENSEYAVSTKPTINLMHGVECALDQTVLSQLYVRTGALPVGQDLKFTDLGLFQLASQLNPAGSLIGELWVSYCVEFFKPILPNDVGGNVLTWRSYRSTFSTADPLGTTAIEEEGDLITTITSKSITFVGQPGNLYLIEIGWLGSNPVAMTYPTATMTNCLAFSYFNNGGTGYLQLPLAGTATAGGTGSIVVRCNSVAPSNCIIDFGVAAVLPTGTTNVNIVVTQISTESFT